MEISVNNNPVFINNGGQEFDTAKPTVILVHGAGMDHSVWGQQTRYIAHHGFNALSIDLPGHGRSGGDALSSIAELGEFLGALIRELGCVKAVLAGHSMGALASLQCACVHGEHVAGVVLCGAADAMPVHPELLAAAEANDIKAAELISSWGHGGPAHRGGNPVHGVWLLSAAIRLMERAPAGVLHRDLAACNDFGSAAAVAGELACPVLLLMGQQDKMASPRAAGGLMEAIASVEQKIIPACGHMMMVEAPVETRKALMGFAQRVTAGD